MFKKTYGDAEILDIEPCHIEDRRVETSRNKRSTILRFTCVICGKPFLAIIATDDTSNFNPLDNACNREIHREHDKLMMEYFTQAEKNEKFPTAEERNEAYYSLYEKAKQTVQASLNNK